MDGAARVEVGRLIGRGEDGAVRVTADHRLAVLVRPGDEIHLDLVALAEILRRAGRIVEAQQLQVPPQVAHGEATESPQPVAHQIALMAVHHEKLPAALAMPQHQTLVHDDLREQLLRLAIALIHVVIQLRRHAL